MFPVEVRCPHCNHSLMDRRRLVDGHPSIRVSIAQGRGHGWLWLSSLYGSHNTESETEIVRDEVAALFCPHCHCHLNNAPPCPDCQAPMASMLVQSGGVVQVCSRAGCNGHMLDVNGPPF
jgi:hypothetical protein